ncbi:hypothetical protein GWK47_054557 [Chionoecetes opilio]|uniref:Uncharacterized protein n=1 Tax=Chionoecetes opilio TaxID=41210 RepID=A0A8J4Y5Z9_CHIOP|nr:hypothetical protein GWK47_054557 [Chionoecetes opilio]
MENPFIPRALVSRGPGCPQAFCMTPRPVVSPRTPRDPGALPDYQPGKEPGHPGVYEASGEKALDKSLRVGYALPPTQSIPPGYHSPQTALVWVWLLSGEIPSLFYLSRMTFPFGLLSAGARWDYGGRISPAAPRFPPPENPAGKTPT